MGYSNEVAASHIEHSRDGIRYACLRAYLEWTRVLGMVHCAFTLLPDRSKIQRERQMTESPSQTIDRLRKVNRQLRKVESRIPAPITFTKAQYKETDELITTAFAILLKLDSQKPKYEPTK
jgi:hypothetical protein